MQPGFLLHQNFPLEPPCVAPDELVWVDEPPLSSELLDCLTDLVTLRVMKVSLDETRFKLSLTV